jgi:hypothetical protein
MKLTTTIASAAVAGVLGLAGVSVAGAVATGSAPTPAVPPTSASTSASTSTTVGHAPGGTKTPAADPGTRAKRAAHLRRRRRRMARIAAVTIGIKPRALVQELRAGKTIAQIATEHGVQPQAVIDALEAAATKRIDAARNAGKITAEQAARLQQRANGAIPRIVNQWHPRARRSG